MKWSCTNKKPMTINQDISVFKCPSSLWIWIDFCGLVWRTNDAYMQTERYRERSLVHNSSEE